MGETLEARVQKKLRVIDKFETNRIKADNSADKILYFLDKYAKAIEAKDSESIFYYKEKIELEELDCGDAMNETNKRILGFQDPKMIIYIIKKYSRNFNEYGNHDKVKKEFEKYITEPYEKVIVKCNNTIKKINELNKKVPDSSLAIRSYKELRAKENHTSTSDLVERVHAEVQKTYT